ncbi:hypothetical protein [Massilia rubra]|uniref:Glycosyl hydrolase n=1 Tax=Massilia rubra TaxID=2607910 RepID=A0ABX0LYF3_9BURK|nr:hypothetical protein [Massilia rubra]NHZ35091.1 hypothetical protein [Massilia rubra]
MRFSSLLFAGLCVAAGAAQASSCTFQKIYWARTSATGQIVVGASFGTVRSADRGKTWEAISGAPVLAAGVTAESFVHTGADGVQLATRATGHRRHLVRKAGAGGPWTRVDLDFGGSPAPYNVVLVGAQGHTLYFIGGEDSQQWGVQAAALYRASGGKADKLVDLDQAVSNESPPFFVGDDGSMAYASRNKLWVSFAAGANWTMIDGQSLTTVPWTECYKAT